MAVTWAIAQLERNASDDGVTVAHWRATDSEVVGSGDDAVTHTGSQYGTCSFNPNPSDSGFVAYNDITETIAIGWVKDSLGADGVTSTETAIADQITESKTPAVVAGVPW